MTSRNADEARDNWLTQVKSDARTTQRHHAAADVLANTDVAPAEHVQAADELVSLGHLRRNPNGTYVPADRKWSLS